MSGEGSNTGRGYKTAVGSQHGGGSDTEMSSTDSGQFQQYDYVRFSFSDLHGMQRGRTVPGRHASRFLNSGIGLYQGVALFGPRGEMPEALAGEHIRRLGRGQGNMMVIPDIATLHPVPWAGFGKYQVGEVLCRLQKTDGSVVASGPRYAAQKQLERLDRMGLQLVSSYELEFILQDRKSEQPVFTGKDILSNLILGEFEKFLYQVDQDMLKAGVDLEMIQTEYSPGQFEITMVPVYGIEGADKALILKQGIKEIAHQCGLEASFMTKPYPKQNGNGAHFNFSVWSNNGNNAFYDKDGENHLSDLARYWIGGIMKHGPALAAFLSPTVNCYRRLHTPWAPSKISWGIDDRHATLRVKNMSWQATYMENRLPSGSANPYLVLAATVAAGLDGVTKKIEPPPERADTSAELPKTLGEALLALEEDTVMVESLGEDLVSWFTTLKRTVDLDILKESDVTSDDPKALAAEREMYDVTM